MKITATLPLTSYKINYQQNKTSYSNDDKNSKHIDIKLSHYPISYVKITPWIK